MSLVNLLKSKKDRKEYQEVKAFVEVVGDYFKLDDVNPVVDFCCGNGMLGFYLLEQNLIKHVTFVDKYKSQQFNKFEEFFSKYNNRYTFNQKNIYDLKNIAGDLFLSIHACNDLTDKIISLAVTLEKDFAVMPCCHQKSLLKKYSGMLPPHLLHSMGLGTYIDLVRAKIVRKKGKNCIIKKIDDRLTKKNNILLSSN